MTKFDDNIKDKRVRNHPLMAGFRKWEKEDYSKADSLTDIFSGVETPYNKKSKDLRNIVAEAVMCVQDHFAQFDLPMQPAIRFINNKEMKYAKYNPDQVVSGNLELEAEFLTLTGVRKKALIPVTVVDSEVIPPSIMLVNGRVGVISEYEVNEMLDRMTSYKLPQLRHTFEPPLTAEQREMAVEVRNEVGWLPSNPQVGNYLQRTSKKAQEIRDRVYGDPADIVGSIDLIKNQERLEGLIEGDLTNYGLSIMDVQDIDIDLAVFSTDDPDLVVIAESDEDSVRVQVYDEKMDTSVETFTFSADDFEDEPDYEFMMERREYKKAQEASIEDIVESELISQLRFSGDVPVPEHTDDSDLTRKALKVIYALGYTDEEIRENPIEPIVDVITVWLRPEKNQEYLTASRKQASMPVPSAYRNVVELMEEAEENMTDTFPRTYDHICRNYILNVVSVASKDQWIIPLINDGFCLNPYGTNVRIRKASSFKTLDRLKRAQEMEKDIEMEITDEPVDVEEMQRFYRDTKTPIEKYDSVKFKHQISGDTIHGTVVDFIPGGDYVMVKGRGADHKGEEFRVELSDIEPLPATFKKMYK